MVTEEQVGQQISIGTRVELVNYNGKKYRKSRNGAHLVGTAPERADLWIEKFQPMRVIHMEKMDQHVDYGEYWMFGFDMDGRTWYSRVWVIDGEYRPTFLKASVHLEVIE